jgi:uncharacterized membrane protein required for colicin V production
MGFRMGIIKAVATLAGTIAGVYLASAYHTQAADVVRQFVNNENLATILGYAIVFVIVMVGAYMAGAVLRKILRLALLGWVDTLAGAGAGLMVAVGIFMALLIPLRDTSLLGLGETISNSFLASRIVDAAPQVQALLPSGFDDMTRFLSSGIGRE